MPPPLQRKRAAAVLREVGRAGPDQPIRAIRPAGRPAAHVARRQDVRDRRQTSSDVRQTDNRQHHRLMPPPRGRGHNKQIGQRDRDQRSR